MKLCVLMATYNGENYLEDQLMSIINQTYTNWTLLIRDDNSSDATPEIIERISKNDKRIKILDNQGMNLKQCQNFNELMKNSDSYDYYMFSDQDDVWHEDKILLSLESIKKHEIDLAPKVPILVYTNYYNTNSKLEILKKAYSKDMNMLVNIDRKILMQNWLMGCTMIFNHAAYNISKNIPNFAVNHDEWIANTVSLFGKVFYLDKVTMKHRIHDSNVTTKSDTITFYNRLKRISKQFKNTEELYLCYLSYYKRLKTISSNNDFNNISLELFKELLNSKGIHGISFMYKHGFLHYTKFQTIIFSIQIFFRENM